MFYSLSFSPYDPLVTKRVTTFRFKGPWQLGLKQNPKGMAGGSGSGGSSCNPIFVFLFS